MVPCFFYQKGHSTQKKGHGVMKKGHGTAPFYFSLDKTLSMESLECKIAGKVSDGYNIW
jgi:hypothetical protein